MNTFVLSIAYLTVAQIQPSQFDPGQGTSPARPAPLTVDPSAAARAGSYRLTDQQPDPATTLSAPEATRLSTPRPDRGFSTAQQPAQAATRAQAEAPVVPIHSTQAEALAAMILEGAIEMRGDGQTDIALVDLLRQLGDNTARQRAVQSYWRLCLAMAEQNFARHEVRYLSELARPPSQLEESLLNRRGDRVSRSGGNRGAEGAGAARELVGRGAFATRRVASSCRSPVRWPLSHAL